MHRVFVYGTLKHGHGNHRLLAGSVFLGSKETMHPLFVMVGHGIPFVYHVEEGWRISGELYEVDDEVLKDLDRLESNGSLYERRPVLLNDGSLAWMYHGMNHDRVEKLDLSDPRDAAALMPIDEDGVQHFPNLWRHQPWDDEGDSIPFEADLLLLEDKSGEKKNVHAIIREAFQKKASA